MSSYLRSRLVVIGLIMLILGSGPLLFVILIATLGLYHDPNPNPVFFGILAGLTFWPSLWSWVLASGGSGAGGNEPEES